MAPKVKESKPEVYVTTELLISDIAEYSGAMEHIKAICRMAMNTMSFSGSEYNHQTFFSAFRVIETLAGGYEDILLSMKDVHALEVANIKKAQERKDAMIGKV